MDQDTRRGLDWRGWCVDRLAELAGGQFEGQVILEESQYAWVEACREAMGGFLSGRMETPGEVEVVATELKFTTTLGGAPFVGFVDRVVREPDGGLVVEDYKTSKDTKAFPVNSIQQVLYVEGLRATGGVNGVVPEKARLLYVRLGEAHDVGCTPAARVQAVERVAQVKQILDEASATGIFPTTRFEYCFFCALAPTCMTRDQSRALYPGSYKVVVPVETGTPPGGPSGVQPCTAQGMSTITPTAGRTTSGQTTGTSPVTGQPPATVEQATIPSTPPAAPAPAPLPGSTTWLRTVGEVTGLREGQYPSHPVNSEGRLNPASFAVDASLDMLYWAGVIIWKAQLADEDTSLAKLHRVLMRIVSRVHERITRGVDGRAGTVDWGSRTNHAARKLVAHVASKVYRAPFGQDANAWRDWETRVYKDAMTRWQIAVSPLLDCFDTPYEPVLNVDWDGVAAEFIHTSAHWRDDDHET